MKYKVSGWLLLMTAVLGGCVAVSNGLWLGDTRQYGKVSDERAEEILSWPEEYRRLTVPYLRDYETSGSNITVESLYREYPTYNSYIASYESEGLKIYGLLTRPKEGGEKQQYPAVVFVHGYIPPASYRTQERYVDYVDYLARNGLVVFKIDLRGHGSSEGQPTGAYYSSDYVIDTLNAYESLKKLDFVDGERVGLWGHSMSGNVVLRSMVSRPEIPVGVIWAGAVYTYVDMQEFRLGDRSYQPSQNPNRNRRQEMYDLVGEVSDNSPFWSMVAPTNYVGELRGKIQLHHAADDSVVSVEYSRNLVNILESEGVDHEYYEYESGGHNLTNPVFGQAMARSVSALKAVTE